MTPAPRTYVWQYMRRDTGRPFGRPRRMTVAEAEVGASRLPVLIVFNTETGEVIW